jgi:hypothetical protein
MSSVIRAVAAVGLAAVLASGVIAARAGSGAGPSGDALAVRDGAGWVTWWQRDDAPVRWGSKAPLAGRVAWRPGAAGVE